MMAQKNKWLQRTLLASALLMTGPLSSASAAVVTSIRPLGFIASAIADGVTPTEVLLPDGASPHDFALRPSDLQRLRAADLVLWVGPDMEAFLTKALSPLPANRQLAISELPAVKPLLMKDDGASMTMNMQPMRIIMPIMMTVTSTITVNIICTFGCLRMWLK